MSSLLWIAGSVGLAACLAVWAYARREEPVSGRAVAGVLRGLALAFLLAGLALPALRPGPDDGGGGPVAILDVSRSMALPVRPDAASRLDSARSLLRGLAPSRVVLLGDDPAASSADDAASVGATARRSRAAPALEVAALSGARRTVVLTDGAWEDRGEAEAVARRLGLGVREVRVGESVSRVGLGRISAPARVAAGDTAVVAVDLVAGGAPGGLPDSVTVELRSRAAVMTSRRVSVPAPGRSARLELALVPAPEEPEEGDFGWRRYEVRLEPGADPLAASDRATFWARVTDEAGGAVLVSVDPDWEPRFLLPVLDRTVLGGARGYLRIGTGGWLRMGARPSPVPEEAVRRDASRARLLAVQGAPAAFPPWLRRTLEAHPRRLIFPRGSGGIPGVPVRLGGALEGEWYAASPPPPGPVAALLAPLPLETLPPLTSLHAAEGEGDPGRWVPLRGRRARRGEERPLMVAGGDARRWAVAAGRGYWRWALREGASRRAYEALVGGVAGWLAEAAVAHPVELEGPPRPRERLRWRIAPGVSDLRLAVRDSIGGIVWSGEWEEAPPTLAGPVPPEGDASFVATGRIGADEFRWTVPFRTEAEPGELLPGVLPPPLVREPVGEEASTGAAGGEERPLWPFAVAALLLCGEWAWRRRIGLR